MPDLTPELAITIVSYNTRSDLEACLRSIFSSRIEPRFQVAVVDNGSTDGSQEMVRTLFPQVKLVESGANLGYGRANNLALLGNLGSFYLILNSDIVLEPGSVQNLVDHLKSCKDAGAAMGALVNPDGSMQTTWAVGELTAASVLWEQSFLARLFPKSRVFGNYFQTYWDRQSPRTLPQACGAFLLVRAELYNRLGGFDPAYFMYCEDTDLSRRIRNAGFKITYLPEARAIHGHGKSSEGTLRPRMIFEHNKSRCYYLEKFAGRGSARAARQMMLAGALVRFFFWAILGLARPSARTKARVFAYLFRETARMSWLASPSK
jgi:GT2 family glycosyltransferase